MNKNLIKFNSKGFTLVELLVVIAIIAILAVVGVTVFTGTQANARDARRRSDIEAISKAWESQYNATTALYPTLGITMFASGAFPRDPSTGASYGYTGASETSGGATYRVCTLSMEKSANVCIDSQQK